MLKNKYISISIVLVALAACCPVLAYTTEKYDDQIENKIVVSPAEMDLKLKPGQEVNQEMLIINRLGRREKIEIIAEGLISKESLSGLSEDYFPNSAADWIKPEIKEIYLDHGERVRFNVQIKVPENAKAGGYYAGVLASFKSPGEEKDNIELINRVGLSFLISIPGEVEEKMTLLGFFKNKFFYLNGPVIFFTEVRNLGNIHLAPAGEIAVYNFLNKKVAQIPLGNVVILPGQNQKWKSSWNERWLLGIYKARLTLRYGEENDKIIEKTIRFWAFPFHILLIIMVIIYISHRIIKKWQEKYEITKKSKSKNQNSK